MCVCVCVYMCVCVCVRACVCTPDNEDLMKALNSLVYSYISHVLTKLPLQQQPTWALCCQHKEVLERERVKREKIRGEEMRMKKRKKGENGGA